MVWPLLNDFFSPFILNNSLEPVFLHFVWEKTFLAEGGRPAPLPPPDRGHAPLDALPI